MTAGHSWKCSAHGCYYYTKRQMLTLSSLSSMRSYLGLWQVQSITSSDRDNFLPAIISRFQFITTTLHNPQPFTFDCQYTRVLILLQPAKHLFRHRQTIRRQFITGFTYFTAQLEPFYKRHSYSTKNCKGSEDFFTTKPSFELSEPTDLTS